MADNRATAYQYFLDKGLTRAQAAGIVGSLMQESGLRTNAKNPSSGALGIAQWLGGRKTNLLKRGNSGSLRGQLDYLWSELQGSESAALKRLKGARNVEDAASAFTWGFERPGKAEANMPNRVRQARSVLGLKTGGTTTSGATADTGTTGTPSTVTQVIATALQQPQRPAVTAPSLPENLTPQGYRPVVSDWQPDSAQTDLQQRIASLQRTDTTTSSSELPTTTSGGARRSGKAVHSPVADGKVIGTPGAGTHTLGNWQSDNAVDIAVPEGTAMRALQDGVVVKVRKHPQDGGRFAGDQITVRGANGNEYFYAHGVAGVKPGQRIKRGQKLGVTGSANGVAHLHFGQQRGDPRRHT